MAEIKCPNCGKVFQVDESGYAQIAAQIRDAEFERALAERGRLAADSARQEREIALSREREQAHAALSQAQAQASEALADRDRQIAVLTERLETADARGKEAAEAQRAVSERALLERDAQIAQLKERLSAQGTATELAVMQATQDLDRQVSDLTAKLGQARADMQREVALKNQQLAEQRQAHELALRDKDAEIDRIQNMRARLNTKLLGESLEQHCENEFNRLRATAFRGATFEKDTEAVVGEDGRATKGDYIFRDYADDGTEFLSIMFEMKTEQEDATRHKRNDDHLAKLDRDRAKKGCEYAVLVSTLEPDSELYNDGIVDVSWKFPKMYVIRPQFFIPMITLLRNAALNVAEYKSELAAERQKNLDVTHFEEALLDFQDKFGRDYERAGKRYAEAIESIDRAIADLQKTKDKLVASENALRLANDKAQGLTIRKLTRKNPTMKGLLDEARAAREDDSETLAD